MTTEQPKEGAYGRDDEVRDERRAPDADAVVAGAFDQKSAENIEEGRDGRKDDEGDIGGHLAEE